MPTNMASIDRKTINGFGRIEMSVLITTSAANFADSASPDLPTAIAINAE